MVVRYPRIDRESTVDELHGLMIRDPYRRLENPADPETIRWQAAQDELWREYLADLPGRPELRARVAELSRTGSITPPVWRGDHRFFLRQEPEQEHAVLLTAGPDGRERVLVDPSALDAQGTVTLDHWQPDLSGARLAFQISRGGDERSELFVLDVGTGRILDGPIDRCRYSPVAWLPDGSGFYYVRAGAGPGNAARRVQLHRVGDPTVCDATVLGPADATTAYGLGISPDGRWLTVSATAASRTGTELWIADLQAGPVTKPDLQQIRTGPDVRAIAEVGPDGRLYVLTDLDCPGGRLCVADPERPAVQEWRELLRPDPGVVLGDFALVHAPEPVLIVGWVRHAISEVSVHNAATGEQTGSVRLPGLGSVGTFSTRPHGGSELWFTYTDSVTPVSVYRYDARSATTALWEAAPGTVRIPDVRSCDVVCTSADGTPLRIVIVAGADAALGADGPRPAILYGYGGFGASLTPTYSSFSLAWVQAGGIFATAHVRGGGEGGRQWHRDGMLDRKQNSVDDFLAAAQLLIADGWTTAAQLAACGESNGGLLVGAAVTQRPDLFAAAVCSAPVLDMVRYERSGLGASWTGEFGSAADPEQLRWLLSYSPYHHVRDGTDYPAVLFTVFGGDSRVDPMHARKMCAALQSATGGPRPILLRQEADVGHGSRAAGRSVALAADMLSFLADNTGLGLPVESIASGAAR